MSEVLSVVRSRFPGRVMDVNLVGGRMYRVKVLTPSGEMMVVAVDARTARILSVRGGKRRRR